MRPTCILISLLATLFFVYTKPLNAERLRSSHLLKRSIDIKKGFRSKNKIAIDSAVDDIKESTAFADREKKWKSMLEGEMFPEHMQSKSKRIEVERNPESEGNNEDDAADNNSPEPVVGEKKNRIQNHDIVHDENLAESFGAEGYDDSNQDNDGDDDSNNDSASDDPGEDSESGSGDAESGEAENNTNNDDTAQPDKEPDESSTAERRQESKIQCHKTCSMPMTYHECAHPRCSLKVGTIKDLCFYLCKHQKERCEDVCE